MLHERGLAYQAESLVNYDPVDQTVLANEQVDANGCSWRSGAKVEQKMLKQWFLNTKEFQEPLLEDLKLLAENGRWPERVLAMQKNWIGRSVGTKLWFEVNNQRSEAKFDAVDVFTTRADTLFGVMYVALSLNHPLAQACAKEDESLRTFIERAKAFPPDSKEGYLLQGIEVWNPLAGLIEDNDIIWRVPVYVAPYVLDDYGSGAVMGVPGHDARDHAFWRQNRSTQPVRQVIIPAPTVMPSFCTGPGDSQHGEDRPNLEKGFVASRDGTFSGVSSDEAIEKIITLLQSAGRPVERTQNWRLRDWLISRQRYWGTPIPIIHCTSCGPVPVPEQDLPVELPSLPDSFFQRRRGNPLAEDEEWKKTQCPKCRAVAERETDTMDTFMDSSWYFFRFLDPKNSQSPVSSTKADQEMPVDVYVGGVEHAILHLLYARFISKFLSTTSVWPRGRQANGEPFQQLITQGMVHGKTYSDPATGRFMRPEEVDLGDPSAPVIKGTDITPTVSYEKMSKSKYNGVDPGATIAKYGADATRAHMLFQAPVSDVLEWDEEKITGVQRWLTRVLRLSTAFGRHAKEMEKVTPSRDIDAGVADLLKALRAANILKVAPKPRNDPYKTDLEELVAALKLDEMELLSKLQETIASVTKSYAETYSLNTVVSDLMTLTNTIWDTPHVSACTPWFKWFATAHLLRMLAPIAPGVAEESWHTLHSTTSLHIRTTTLHPFHDNGDSSIFAFGFPTANLDILPLLNPTTPCVVQVNGKKKFQANIQKVPLTIPSQDDPAVKQWVLKHLLQTDLGKKYMDRETGAVWKAGGFGERHPIYRLVPNDWTVIVAKRGRIVNLVSPKKVGGSKRDTESRIEKGGNVIGKKTGGK